MKKIRVLLVWGSETNCTHGFADNIAKDWREKHGDALEALDVVRGDDMADRWDEITADNYDFLLVATSSYGEGEPPSGFGKFLYRLQEASKQREKRLEGLQHAVLGIGSTCYETFQNCPRHVDKYLGEAGSRRCQQRFEWDEMEHAESDVSEWGDQIFEVMTNNASNGAAKEPEVCAWSEPKSELLDKIVDEDGYEVGNGPPGFGVRQIAMLSSGALGFVSAYWFFKMQRAADETSEL